ncbi:MAG: type II toxin-antitoxin system VapB family antitoxin [Balneolaceae bacterium]|nr:type II toxin-antitoxin system VapB family antitoxin [Balneolaceae bacterium]
MRTTLDLPEDLLQKAMRLSNQKTKTSTIILALEELVRKSTLSDIKDFKGKVDLDIDIDKLRDRQK